MFPLRLQFPLMFLKKLLMALLQSDLFQSEHQLVERCLLGLCPNGPILFGIILLILHSTAGRKAVCPLLWCNYQWATSRVRDCSKSYFNRTEQIQGMKSFLSVRYFVHFGMTMTMRHLFRSLCVFVHLLHSVILSNCNIITWFFQLLYFEQDANASYGLALQVCSFIWCFINPVFC